MLDGERAHRLAGALMPGDTGAGKHVALLRGLLKPTQPALFVFVPVVPVNDSG